MEGVTFRDPAVAAQLDERFVESRLHMDGFGIVPVVMGTFEFEQLAKLEAKNRGIEALPLALVPHPLGGIPEDEVVRKADLALESVLKAITK